MGCRTVASSTSTAPSPARSCARIRRSVSMSDSRGTRRATGLPCLVIVSGSWLSATASSSARHRCLNSPAATWPQPKIRSTHAPEPAAAPPEPLPVASRVPDSPRDDPFAELSPGPSSAAPLLHPQRQRELIEQAAGMSTRQVAGLLAGAAPEVVPPRDTLRAVAPDRCTLKVSIDQECEQGLRRLKGLLSHLDPRMSWGDLGTRRCSCRHPYRSGCRNSIWRLCSGAQLDLSEITSRYGGSGGRLVSSGHDGGAVVLRLCHGSVFEPQAGASDV